MSPLIFLLRLNWIDSRLDDLLPPHPSRKSMRTTTALPTSDGFERNGKGDEGDLVAMFATRGGLLLAPSRERPRL